MRSHTHCIQTSHTLQEPGATGVVSVCLEGASMHMAQRNFDMKLTAALDCFSLRDLAHADGSPYAKIIDSVCVGVPRRYTFQGICARAKRKTGF